MADDRGWYKMHRGWLDHPMFSNTEFCPRAAWIWLIENACWEPKRVKVSGHMFDLGRGQLTYSLSYLSEAWGWHVSKIRRFLNQLKIDTMIDIAATQGQTIITICNYDEYQEAEKVNFQNPTQQPTRERHSSDTNIKNLRTKELKKEVVDSGASLFGDASPATSLVKINGVKIPDWDGDNHTQIPKGALVKLSASPRWGLPDDVFAHCKGMGWDHDQLMDEIEKFYGYWALTKSARKSVKGWTQAWFNWLRIASENANRRSYNGNQEKQWNG